MNIQKDTQEKGNIIIMGAGAIGSVIGGMLARQGHKVTLIGRQPHMEAVAEHGLHVSGIWGEHTVRGLAIFGAVMPQPGSVEITVIASETLVGELDGSSTPRVDAAARMLDNAGIPTKVSDNIIQDIWIKALYNIALNPLSALFQMPYGCIADNPHTRWLIEQMVSEAFAVAEAEGIDLGLASPQEFLQILWEEKLPPTREHRSSMLQDILRGRRTEIDYINGAMVRLGREHGIETPYNNAVVRMVKAKEGFGFH